MNKGKFEYPQQAYDVVVGSTQSNFNISSTYFEYLIYVLPDTFSSGSYRIDVTLEKAYQPVAFEDPVDDGEGESVGNNTQVDGNITTN